MNYLAQVPTNVGSPLRGLGPLGLFNRNPSEGISIFSSVLSGTIGLLTVIAIIFFLFKFIIGAIGIISAGGDKAKVESARGNITNGIVGLILVIIAVFVADLIGYLLGIPILNLAELVQKITF